MKRERKENNSIKINSRPFGLGNYYDGFVFSITENRSRKQCGRRSDQSL